MQAGTPDIGKFFETVGNLIAQFGWVKGTFTVFFWLAHFWVFRLYQARLKDRQVEIDRLATDNREYREHFMKILERAQQQPPQFPEAKG